MRWGALLCAGLLAGQGAAQEAPVAIGRISYGETMAPGAAICTGALVAADLVLTARHCVEGAAADPASIRFAAGFAEGHSLALRQGAEVILPQGEVSGLHANDVALLRLDPPIPADEVAVLGLGDPALVDWVKGFTLIAYRRAAPDLAQRQEDCALLVRQPGVLALSCPVVSGNSGAPLLAWDGTDWRIVGVMVATSSGSTVQSLAATLPPDLVARITSAAAP